MSSSSPATPTATERFTRSGLHVMAKPIGPICNLDCEYCYYLHKEELYPQETRWRMPEETLSSYIRQMFQTVQPGQSEIEFAWQGGEPTLLGVAFFERIIELQREHAPRSIRIRNCLQTNGVLLDDEWCAFLKRHQVLVGLSIDGPADVHDRYRYDKKGDKTFDRVRRALQRLQKHGVDYNVLVTVHRANGDHGRRVYTFLRDAGVEHIQLIPIVEQLGVGQHPETELPDGALVHPLAKHVSSRSVTPTQWGQFLIDVFEEWSRRDIGRVFVQMFDQALSSWLGVEPTLCIFRKRCGRALALEHNGDLYSCDHFVDEEHRLGNIVELSIVEMANSPRQQAFGDAKEETLPNYCRECEVRFACNGECPKNRFVDTPDGEAGLNYLCEGYRRFFNHADPLMKRMAQAIRERRPPASVMRPATPPKRQTGRGQKPASVGRNDPCPCGSGLKAKKCCYR